LPVRPRQPGSSDMLMLYYCLNMNCHGQDQGRDDDDERTSVAWHKSEDCKDM